MNASERSSKRKVDQIIRDICEQLYDDNLYSNENQKWHKLCKNWFGQIEQDQLDIKEEKSVMNGKRAKLIDYINLYVQKICIVSCFELSVSSSI